MPTSRSDDMVPCFLQRPERDIQERGACRPQGSGPRGTRRSACFRSRCGSAKLTEGLYLYKKRQTRHHVPSLRLQPALAGLALLLPGGLSGQTIFGWPLRAAVQPEGVLTGAGAVFWNPGGLAAQAGTQQEAWIIHVDGPDVTGVRGAGAAGVLDLPVGVRAGIGYWHLGVHDIPRTTTSPSQEIGDIDVSEDVAVLSLTWGLGHRTGIGCGVRFERGSAGRYARSRMAGEVGISHSSGLPLLPRFGFALQGLGQDWKAVLGTEAKVATLAAGRIPVRAGYGIQSGSGFHRLDHRFSLRGSWMDQIHLGMGVSRLADGDGWTSLWTLGADLGRYSLSILRESLANNFGPVHYFQASIRFPG